MTHLCLICFCVLQVYIMKRIWTMGRKRRNCKGGPLKSWVRLRMSAKIAVKAFLEIGYQLFTVKFERSMNDTSGEKADIFWIHVRLHICSRNLDEELGSMLMMSWICAELQIFQKNMRAVLAAIWPGVNIIILCGGKPKKHTKKWFI